MDTYYAAGETEDAIKQIFKVIYQQQQNVLTGETSAAWKKNLEIYYKCVNYNGVTFGGLQGELVQLSVPQARSLARQSITLVCKQKLEFKSIMRSSSYSSISSGAISDAIAAQLVKKQKLNRKRETHTERAYIFGRSFLHVTWDSNLGNIVDPLSQERTGDVKIEVLHPAYVYYDSKHNNWSDLNAVTVAIRMNRFDLIAEHPELEDELLKVPSFSSDRAITNLTNISTFSGGDITDVDKNTILVYIFYHKPTSAMPSGRMLIASNEKTVLYDGPNPYECIPVIPCIPEQLDDVLIGYPLFSNLTGAQEMLDNNFSTIASNQSAFGLNVLMLPQGSNMTMDDVRGINVMYYIPNSSADGGGEPKSLSLSKTSPEIYDSIALYRNHMSEIANINGALRGDPPSGVTAASAIATLTANSVEFFSSLTATVHESLDEAVSLAIRYYHMFGAEKQLVTMVDGNISYVKEFKSADLAEFDKVEIQLANPLMNTLSGRMQTANDLLTQGLIPSIGDYYRVLEGAPPKVAYQESLDEAYLIQKENDDMQQGIVCLVLDQDNHQEHIAKHKCLLRNPETRRQGQNLQVITEHIMQHEQMLMSKMPPPNNGAPAPSGASSSGGMPPAGNQPIGAQPASPTQPKVSL